MEIINTLLQTATIGFPALAALILIKDQYSNSKVTGPLAWAMGLIFWGYISAVIIGYIQKNDTGSIIIMLSVGVFVTAVLLYAYFKSKSKK